MESQRYSANNDLLFYIGEKIETWKKYAPDYEIKEWNETNCNINANDFVKKYYQEGNWAFASDWCRFEALYQEGGIYFDTDTVLNKSMDNLLTNRFFFTLEGNGSVSSSFIGAQKKDLFILKLLENFSKQEWPSSPALVTSALEEKYPQITQTKSIQKAENILILPANFGMINFGGGENYAEHFYSFAWHGENRSQSPYYDVYKETFLKEKALLLRYPDQEEYLIPLDETTYYSYTTKNRATVQKKEENLIIQWADGKIEHFVKKENGYIQED